MAASVLFGFIWIWFALPSTLQTRALATSAHIHVRKSETHSLALLGSRFDYSLNSSLDNVSPHFVHAIIASEDHRFYEHGAPYKISKFFQAGARCIFKKANVFAAERGCRGNSTIPQQLARNLFLSESRSIARKLKELVWALKMEWGLSKNEILEMYLNRVYLGEGNYGVEMASRSYFGKPASRLGVIESAYLAAAIKRPNWNYHGRRDKAAERAALILRLMKNRGYADQSVQMPGVFEPELGERPPWKPYLGHLWQWLRPAIASALAQQPAGDYKILTSLNAEVQIYAERHLTAEVQRLSERGVPVTQGTVVVLQADGRVLAMVGGVGKDLTARGLNRAKRTSGLHTRPPASAFKPFVYLAALESGMDRNTLIDASPISIPMRGSEPYAPRNHDGRTRLGATAPRPAGVRRADGHVEASRTADRDNASTMGARARCKPSVANRAGQRLRRIRQRWIRHPAFRDLDDLRRVGKNHLASRSTARAPGLRSKCDIGTQSPAARGGRSRHGFAGSTRFGSQHPDRGQDRHGRQLRRRLVRRLRFWHRDLRLDGQ
jgi:penicillin-binding protein 1A